MLIYHMWNNGVPASFNSLEPSPMNWKVQDLLYSSSSVKTIIIHENQLIKWRPFLHSFVSSCFCPMSIESIGGAIYKLTCAYHWLALPLISIGMLL
jgi:hypothetical protein